MAELIPLKRRSIVDEAVDAMRVRILHGAWPVGEKLPTEHDLAEQLGVGRSTVREALNRLGSMGLVEIPHGGSKRVRDWRDAAGLDVLADLVVSPEGVVDLRVVRSVVEMRDAIAPDVARLAAVRCSDERGRRLLDRVDELDPKHGLEVLLPRTLEWWTELVLASDNLAYRLAFNTLLNTYTESRPVVRSLIEPELRAQERYRAVTRAVLAHEPDEAASQCRALVSLGSAPLYAAIRAATGES